MPLLLTVGIVALAVLMAPPAAVAKGKHGRGHGNGHGKKHWASVERQGWHHEHHSGGHYDEGHHQSGHSRGRGHAHRRFEVPRAIHGHYVRAYEPYYHSRSYYAPHHHHHVVYAFPVFYDPYGHPYPQPVYYPYAYCEGGFFARGVFTDHGPRFSLAVSIVK
jgi:hypothetical protein